MGQILKVYPIRQLEVFCGHYQDTLDNERLKLGDIIVARPPKNYIGFGQMYRSIWIPVEGLEEGEMNQLESRIVEDGVNFDKRRYCVPLLRLKEIVPSFKVNRALDSTDLYQPFLTLDEETGIIFRVDPPLEAQGLIWDKARGVYL